MWLQLCDAFQNKRVELLEIFKSNPTDLIGLLKRGCGVANTAQYEAAELVRSSRGLMAWKHTSLPDAQG